MGTIFQLPVVEVGSSRCDDRTTQRAVPTHQTLAQTLRDLRTRGIRCIAGNAAGQVQFMGYLGIQILLSDYGRTLTADEESPKQTCGAAR